MWQGPCVKLLSSDSKKAALNSYIASKELWFIIIIFKWETYIKRSEAYPDHHVNKLFFIPKHKHFSAISYRRLHEFGRYANCYDVTYMYESLPAIC